MSITAEQGNTLKDAYNDVIRGLGKYIFSGLYFPCHS